MTPERFVMSLRGVAFANVFNPYADRCKVHDLRDAPQLRAEALQNFLEAACLAEIDAIWVGRDLGHRGGRRTGLALTDDIHLASHADRWDVSVRRATVGAMVAERTAAVIWSMLEMISLRVFLWNVFPFHPHLENDPFSNRAHKRSERVVGEELLSALIAMLRPKRIIAIGNDAAQTATRVAILAKVERVRHPSYGGQRDFVAQISRLYSLTPQRRQLTLLH